MALLPSAAGSRELQRRHHRVPRTASPQSHSQHRRGRAGAEHPELQKHQLTPSNSPPSRLKRGCSGPEARGGFSWAPSPRPRGADPCSPTPPPLMSTAPPEDQDKTLTPRDHRTPTAPSPPSSALDTGSTRIPRPVQTLPQGERGDPALLRGPPGDLGGVSPGGCLVSATSGSEPHTT